MTDRDQYQRDCGPLLSSRHRQYIDHRTGYTDAGFATPEGSSPPDIDSRPRQAKSEINNRRISYRLKAFADDLQRIDKFYTSIREDREAFHDVLHKNKLIIENLHREIERWKTLADTESDRKEQVEQAWEERYVRLQDILSPLYDGLQNSEKPRQEFDERINALKTICDKELTEIFEYVIETPKEEQISEKQLKEKHGGWQWNKWATERLEQDHGLVEGDRWGQKRKSFTLTERGKVVYEALKSLLGSEYIEQYQQDGESREKAAFKALSQPHPIER